MDMQKTLLIIIGPHAVGKMTVGQELERITELKLFHNHMSIELVRKLFKHSDKEWSKLNTTIRQTVFELFAKGDFPGLIFTYMCDFDMQSEFDYLDSVMSIFKQNGAECHVVELCADFDVRLERNKTENRLANKESKRDLEWSEREMRKTSGEHRLNSYDGEKLSFESYLKLDNTHIEPSNAARIIKEHFDL
jgi:hypothetical protein